MSISPLANENFVWLGPQRPLGLTCTMRSRRLQHTVMLRRVLALAAAAAPATAIITTNAAALTCLVVIRDAPLYDGARRPERRGPSTHAAALYR